MAYKTINPYTNEVEKEFPNATDEELEAVLAKSTPIIFRLAK